MGTNSRHKADAGFTLIELLIVMVVSSVLLGVAVFLFIAFVNTSAKESAKDTMNAEVAAVFKILEKEVMLAGYGLPPGTMIASENNCTAGDCLNGTDRLFIADGMQILKDITDNNEDDGLIAPAYMTNIATARNSAIGGYYSFLTAPAGQGDNVLSLDYMDINYGEERNAPTYDFVPGKALIIGDNARVEGHRISAAAPAPPAAPPAPPGPCCSPHDTNFTSTSTAGMVNGTVTLSDVIADVGGFQSAAAPRAIVVPATVWYVGRDGWLYRNSDKVLPNVTGMKVQYGYDANNDGLEWRYTVPPPVENPAIPDKTTSFNFSFLKMIRITLTVRLVYKTEVRTTDYKTEILLRNRKFQ